MRINNEANIRISCKCLVFILSIISLSGCVSYNPIHLSPVNNAARLEAQTLDKPELRRFIETSRGKQFSEWPLKSWDYTNLFMAAVFYHPELSLARARLSSAKAGRITAGERPNPTISLVPGYNTTSSGISPWFPGLSVNFPVETGGKRAHRINVASNLIESARLNVISMAWNVRSNVRRCMLDMYSIRETGLLLKHQEEIQSKIVDIMKLRRTEGDISVFDFNQAQITLDTVRNAFQENSVQENQARVRLANSLGLTASALKDIVIDFDVFDSNLPEIDLQAARKQAVFNRSDVLIALSDFEATQCSLQLEIAKQYPDINIGPGYQFDQGEDKWSVGIAFTLPVFNRNKGPIAEACAKREEAVARFNVVQAGVISQVDQAIAGYGNAVTRLKTCEELRLKMETQQKSLKAVLKAGEISRLEATIAEMELCNSAKERISSFTRIHQAIADIEDALQSPAGLPEAEWIISPEKGDSKKEQKHE